MHMTLQQLKLFEAVTRNNSFTLAARELELSQPAVSIQIKRLENQAGMPLFEQLGKKIFPTLAGKLMYDASQDILQRVEQLKTDMEELNGKVKGKLNLSVVTTTKYFLPRILGNFLHEYPDVEPRLNFTNRAQVIERLYNNKDDLVILGQIPEDNNLQSYPFMENQLVVVAPPDHPLATQKDIELELLSEERIIEREQGSGTRLMFDNLLENKDFTVKTYMELGSSEAVKQAVIAKLGIAVLSLHSVRHELESKRLCILDVKGFPIKSRWYIVHLKSLQLSLVARTFLDFILKSTKTLDSSEATIAIQE